MKDWGLNFVPSERSYISCSVFPILILWLRFVMASQSHNITFDHVFPTPLTNKLNETAAALLRVQTENVSVSNTSLDDLYNDNDTQQMQIRYRERKRQERLLMIQRDILQKLGFSKEPNMTSRLTEEERERMIQIYDRRRSHEMGYTNTNSTDTENTLESDA